MSARGLLCVFALSLCAAFEARADVPAGFLEETVVAGIEQPVDLAFLPDGRLLAVLRRGEIRLIDPNVVPPTNDPYLYLPVDSFGERGLLGIVRDPSFAANGFFYVFWSPADSDRFRLSRFTHLGNSASTASEFLLWEDPTPASACCHQGGGLDIGPDGNIYLALGEEFGPAQAQDLTQPGGKILRLTLGGSIPPDNPFVDGPGGALDEIWAFGLRNPFRIRWDAPTDRLFIAEVGGNDDQTSWEDIHLGTSGGNYGWPACEGDCPQPEYNDPIYTYQHLGAGASVMGGFVYRGNRFPFAYNGAYFWADFVRGEIHYLSFDDDEHVTGSTLFDPDAGPVTALVQGPFGELYYTVYSSANGQIRRVTYQNGNLSPQIVQATVDVEAGTAPLSVNFSGAATDPEMDALTYLWDFGDDTSMNGADVSHEYGSNGVYQARLFVSDPFDTVFSAPIEIRVGQPPIVTIQQPMDGALFRAGDSIAFSATVAP